MLEGYKTLIGAGVAFIGAILQTFGIDMGDPTPYVNSILLFGGLALTIYGRVVAKTPVGGTNA